MHSPHRTQPTRIIDYLIQMPFHSKEAEPYVSEISPLLTIIKLTVNLIPNVSQELLSRQVPSSLFLMTYCSNHKRMTCHLLLLLSFQ